MIPALHLRTKIAESKASFHFIFESFCWFTNHHLSLSPLEGSGRLLPGGGQVSLSGSKVDGIYLVISDGQGIYLRC